MIDAKELRIGNWVDLRGSVSPIGYGYIGDLYQIQKGITNRYLVTIPPATGIPLTPKILEKFGFTEKNTDTMFPYWEIRHTRINELVEYVFKISTMGDDEWRWIEGNSNVPIYYLHELQNLYYALRGKELEINL